MKIEYPHFQLNNRQAEVGSAPVKISSYNDYNGGILEIRHVLTLLILIMGNGSFNCMSVQ